MCVVCVCIMCSVCILCEKYVCGVQFVCLHVSLHVLRGSGPGRGIIVGWLQVKEKDSPFCTSFEKVTFEERGKGVEGNHGLGRSCFFLHLFSESEAQLKKGRNPS